MTTYLKVKQILEQKPLTRNSDNELFWEYATQKGLTGWYGRTLEKAQFMDIKFESLRRARQAVQQSHPELRGSNYKLRHKKASEYPVFLEEDGQVRGL